MKDNYKTDSEYLHQIDKITRERLITNLRTWAILISTTSFLIYIDKVDITRPSFISTGLIFSIIPIALNALAWLFWIQLTLGGITNFPRYLSNQEDPRRDTWQYFEEYRTELLLLRKERRIIGFVDLLVATQMILLSLGAAFYVAQGAAP